MALDIYFLPEPTFITDKVEYLALAEPRPVPFDAIWRLIYSAPTFVGQLVDDAVKSGAQVDEADLIFAVAVQDNVQLMKDIIMAGTRLAEHDVEEMPLAALRRKALQIIKTTVDAHGLQELGRQIRPTLKHFSKALGGLAA